MTQRQLNMLQSIQDGLELARSELSGVGGGLPHAMKVIESEVFGEDYRAYSAGHLAYLACMILVWKDAGSPDFT